MFRKPEVPDRFGAVEDEAIIDGEPGGAEVLRAMGRNANRLVVRGDLIFRACFDPDPSSEGPGVAKSFAPPYWQHLIPVPAVPVSKKFGITTARARIRISVTSGRTILLYVGTAQRPTPVGRPMDELIKILGTGSTEPYDFEFPVREQRGEILSIYYRAIIDPVNDPLMNTGTFGTVNQGVVDTGGAFEFSDNGSAWNASGANQPHLGGHYVYFTDSSDTTPIHGPAEVRQTVSATSLSFYPPAPQHQALRGSTFTLRKLPAVQLVSIAIYGKSREVPA
jgi:hypothetical protein